MFFKATQIETLSVDNNIITWAFAGQNPSCSVLLTTDRYAFDACVPGALPEVFRSPSLRLQLRWRLERFEGIIQDVR